MKKYPWPENIFNNFTIERAFHVEEYADFVISFHYSGTLARGCPDIFLLKSDGKLYGVAMFGCPVGRNSPGDIECKRFVLMRKAPKNVRMGKFYARFGKSKPGETGVVNTSIVYGNSGDAKTILVYVTRTKAVLLTRVNKTVKKLPDSWKKSVYSK